MKFKILKCIVLILSMICILCFPIGVSATPQGTDGTELQVMQPQNLEIHLGQEWSGTAFQLRTDAGLYPGVIAVGEDGTLRLEIGGSSNYILSCVSSDDAVRAPADSHPETGELPSAAEPSEGTVPPENISEEDAIPTEIPSETPMEDTATGIPTKHIVMFGCGLVMAIGILVGLRFTRKRGGNPDEDQEI